MDHNEDILQLDFDKIKEIRGIDYMDDGIAFYSDIRELPIEIESESIRIDIYLVIACVCGKVQMNLNSETYTLRKNEILVCRPNEIIDNLMLSLDFKGLALCMSQKGLLEQVFENDLWEKAFHITENPKICINDGSLHMFNLYGTILTEKAKMGHTPFHREIITSIIKAALYELLSNIGTNTISSYGSGLIKQREVLFKRFFGLLTGTRVKPRCVSWYADQLCVTPKYLSTVCKQVSGKTAFDWANEYVMIDIRSKLKSSHKSIKEIADMLGFPTISSFGKYCRKHFGMSPTEYRRQLRRQPDECQ